MDGEDKEGQCLALIQEKFKYISAGVIFVLKLMILFKRTLPLDSYKVCEKFCVNYCLCIKWLILRKSAFNRIIALPYLMFYSLVLIPQV